MAKLRIELEINLPENIIIARQLLIFGMKLRAPLKTDSAAMNFFSPLKLYRCKALLFSHTLASVCSASIIGKAIVFLAVINYALTAFSAC